MQKFRKNCGWKSQNISLTTKILSLQTLSSLTTHQQWLQLRNTKQTLKKLWKLWRNVTYWKFKISFTCFLKMQKLKIWNNIFVNASMTMSKKLKDCVNKLKDILKVLRSLETKREVWEINTLLLIQAKLVTFALEQFLTKNFSFSHVLMPSIVNVFKFTLRNTRQKILVLNRLWK